MSSWSFKPTYKEWKRNRWRCKMVDRKMRFKPTYKEWKLSPLPLSGLG